MLGSGPWQRPKGPVRFAFDDCPEEQRPTLLRECFARVGVHYDFSAPRDAPFHVDLALNPFPGLLVGVGRLQAMRRRGTRELAAQMSDDAALLVNLKGTHRIEQRNQDIVLGEGEAAFTSCSDVSTIVHGDASEMLVLRLPKSGVAPLVDRLDDGWARRIPCEVPALRLLCSYLTLAWDDQTRAGPDVQRSVVTHVYDLLALMMSAGRDTVAMAQARGVRAARLHALKQDIGRHLDRLDLSVAALAQRHGCTPRLVQRLFEQEGSTFTEYVLAERLGRAYQMLADPRRRAEKISTVAFDCGFADVSYFNRAFRRRYGAAPSDVRAQMQPAMFGRRAH
jgi:AraC-like DNA-binding protein